MAKDNLPQQIDFTKDDWFKPKPPEEPREFWEWGKWTVVGPFFYTPFIKGGELVLDYLITDDGSPWSRKGYAGGGKIEGVVLVQERETLDGDLYHRYHFLTGHGTVPVNNDNRSLFGDLNLTASEEAKLKEGKTLKVALWHNLTAPALMEATHEYTFSQTSLTGKGVYGAALKLPTGEDPDEDPTRTNEDGTPVKYYKNYFGKFRFFKTKKDYEEAMEEYFNGLGETTKTPSSTSGTKYPATWGEHTASMLDFIRKLVNEEGASHKEAAEKSQLLGAKTASGADVDVAAVLSEALDVPEPMLDL